MEPAPSLGERMAFTIIGAAVGVLIRFWLAIPVPAEADGVTYFLFAMTGAVAGACLGRRALRALSVLLWG